MEILQNLIAFAIFCGIVYLIYSRAPSLQEKVHGLLDKVKSMFNK